MRRALTGFGLAVCLGLLPGCIEEAVPTGTAGETAAALPTISALNARVENGLVALTLAVSDPSGGPVDVAWRATGGRLSTSIGTSVLWQPLGEGEFQVTATATTRKGT